MARRVIAASRVRTYTGLATTPSRATAHQMASRVGLAGLGWERADQSTTMCVSNSGIDNNLWDAAELDKPWRSEQWRTLVVQLAMNLWRGFP